VVWLVFLVPPFFSPLIWLSRNEIRTLPSGAADVRVDGKDVWDDLTRRGTDTKRTDATYLIPICALAPTVPRTHNPNVGWNNNVDPI
jgi:hypothetical protein